MDQSTRATTQAQPGGSGIRHRPTALVTGASGGIGLELARILAAHGYDVILVARSAERLEQLTGELRRGSGVQATALRADLADPDAPGHIVQHLADTGATVDVLVNNAGFGLVGRFDQRPWPVERDMIAVNVTALTALTRHLLPEMVTRGEGHVLNVASTAAFQPGPLMAVYYATKAYVLSFSEAIAEELRDTGVSVTALCPGPTATGFAEAAEMSHSRLFRSRFVADARSVAEYGYRAMMRGQRVAIPGALNRLVAFSNRLAPRRLVTRLARLAQEHR